jgi:hypothetical protein
VTWVGSSGNGMKRDGTRHQSTRTASAEIAGARAEKI